MDYNDDILAVQRDNESRFIQTRWSQLYTLSKDAGDDATKYLFTVNAGGSVATIAYLGTMSTSDITNTTSITVSLAFFFLGLILVGILKAYMLTRMDRLFTQYQDLVNQYYSNKLTWNELTESDEENVGNPKTPYILGYVSFGCFIIGSIIGAFAL